MQLERNICTSYLLSNPGKKLKQTEQASEQKWTNLHFHCGHVNMQIFLENDVVAKSYHRLKRFEQQKNLRMSCAIGRKTLCQGGGRVPKLLRQMPNSLGISNGKPPVFPCWWAWLIPTWAKTAKTIHWYTDTPTRSHDQHMYPPEASTHLIFMFVPLAFAMRSHSSCTAKTPFET